MTTQSKVKIIKNIVIVILSLIAIISAIVETNYSENPGSFVDSKYYGGDAYTGIQQAAAKGANNTRLLNMEISHYFRSVMWIIAIAFAILLVKAIFNIVEEIMKSNGMISGQNFNFKNAQVETKTDTELK